MPHAVTILDVECSHDLYCVRAFVYNSLHTYSDLDREIREIIRRQSDAGYDGRQALEDAEKTIEILFARIKNIREKAERTEQTVSASKEPKVE